MSSTQGPPCDLLITGGRILDLGAESGVLDDAGIAVRDGVIVDVGQRAEVSRCGGPRALLMPPGR